MKWSLRKGVVKVITSIMSGQKLTHATPQRRHAVYKFRCVVA